MNSPILRYADFTFYLCPEGRLYWPRSRRGSIVRGALGSILRNVACDPLCPEPAHCRFADHCAHQRIFAPCTPSNATRLSMNQDLPRPFVVIVDTATNSDYVERGETFSFTVRLFGTAIDLSAYVSLVFSELGYQGFGHDRVPCRIVRQDATTSKEMELNVPEDSADRIDDIQVDFVTPVYLKAAGREVRFGAEAFAPLIKRARDRISALYHFFSDDAAAGIELTWDFRGIGEACNSIACVADTTEWVDRKRRSTRTGQLHDLSGMIGQAVYRAVPMPLQRILELAEVTHVGKHAAFGMGQLTIAKP